jgi:hypothetical protein
MRSNPTLAEPPSGGRQDHDVMRTAAMRPVTGPASTDTLAAGGGLDVPGRESHPELAPASADRGAPGAGAHHEIIPGERDATTLTHREAGAIGGQFSGGDIPSPDPSAWLDEETAFEHAREGGGNAARNREQQRGRVKPDDRESR